MKKRYGKDIAPRKFQQEVLKDVREYTKRMGKRAKKYLKHAQVKVDSCYVCGQSKSKKLLEVYGYEYRQCGNCSHVRSTRRLSDKALEQYYAESGEYASTYTSKKQVKYRIENISKPKIDFAMEFAPMRGKWLDVGCAIGDAVYAVEQHKGWKGTGIEISKESVKKGKRMLGVDLKRQILRDYLRENPNVKYEAISFFGYLEVITDPMEELKIAVERLTKGGILVVGEAMADSFSTTTQQSYPDLSRRHLLPPTVIQQFTKESLLYALKKVGVKPVGWWRFGLDVYEWLGQLVQQVDGFGESPAYEYLMERMNDLQREIDKDEKGDNVVVVARK